MEKHEDQKAAWNRFWLRGRRSSLREIMRYTSLSARTKKIEQIILEHFNSFKGLEVIELGSGMGTESLVMASKGAKVTLIDFSEVALEKAKELFGEMDLNPTCCKSDILGLDSDFFGKFDISMSFGTVEHFFSDLKTRQAVDAHYKVLKEGGMSFISVPNKMCPHYQFFSRIARMVRRSISERAFESYELRRYAMQAGYKSFRTFGSSLFELDFLMPYFYAPVQTQIATPLDNYCAHALTLFAIK